MISIRRAALLTGLLIAWGAAPVGVWAGGVYGRLELPNGIFPGVSPPIVYLEIVGQTVAAIDVPDAVVNQLHLQFRPRVQAVQWGGRIRFHNSDGEMHNVHSRSPCCVFNLAVTPGAVVADDATRPSKPGVVRLLCDIHPHMRGYIVVVQGPHFVQADADGRFRIEGVPDGPANLHVWQEFSQPVNKAIVVSGNTQVEARLEWKEGLLIPGSAQVAPPIPWPEVVERVGRTLEAAVESAERLDGAAKAEKLALDAYFEHFEAAELEPAIARYVGGKRVFALERLFHQIRAELVELAAGHVSREAVQEEIAHLIAELNVDVRKLHAQGVMDKSTLAVKAGSTPFERTPALEGGLVREVLRDLRREFRRASETAEAGQARAASAQLVSAYFDHFHRIEPALLSADFLATRQIEAEFTQVRGMLTAGETEGVRGRLVNLYQQIKRAAEPRSWMAMALNALLIVLREGVEAILIVTALITCLVKSGQQSQVRYVYWGVAWALVASIVTWLALTHVVAASGFGQELLEGIVALLAAAVLFYVSYWLISKSQARAWQQFLAERIEVNAARGRRWALASTAFLAVYREGAETIVMFQPLVGGQGGWAIIAVALLVGGVILAGVFWGFRYLGLRLPLRPFFTVTGSMLFVLAVIFAGKGTAELQEAGVLKITTMAWVPHIPDLGVYPTVQTVLIQGVLVAGAVLGGLVLWVNSRETASVGVNAAVGVGGAKT